jgi:hypothetical protein
MTIAAHEDDQPIKTSLLNAFINKVNNSPGAQLFTSDGTFTVPDDVHRIRVTICSYGGAATTYDPFGSTQAYYNGGNSPLAVKYINVEPGASYAVNLASSRSQPSTFGSVLSSNGGGNAGSNNHGSTGSHNGTFAMAPIVMGPSGIPYGRGGIAASSPQYGSNSVMNPGAAMCLVEW